MQQRAWYLLSALHCGVFVGLYEHTGDWFFLPLAAVAAALTVGFLVNRP